MPITCRPGVWHETVEVVLLLLTLDDSAEMNFIHSPKTDFMVDGAKE